jgi:phosphoenolpyruvate-protein phosphotransferase (PTS system enzyme I)
MAPGYAINRLKGGCASPGRAMGPIVRMSFASSGERRAGLDETGALNAALETAARDLAALAARSDAETAELLEFQSALIEDEALLAPVREEIAAGAPADLAWRRIANDLIAEYARSASEHVQARSLDVADLRERVLSHLRDEVQVVPPLAGAIVVADDLPPSRFLEMDWSQGGGVALSRGSAMSHTAILARARRVPMLTQLGEVPAATHALLDGDQGLLLLDPGEAERGAYTAPAAPIAVPDHRATLFRGERVRLLINIEGPESLSDPAADYCDGVGLMRTEYLLLGRASAPDESTQLQAYAEVLRWAHGRPVTIRTFDAGGDKAVAGLSESGEANPFLGVRGLRLSLRRPDMFVPQLRALCRAAALGDLKLMFPMVTTAREFAAAERLVHEVVAALRAEGVEARLPEIGMMVEVPAAAMTIADFPAAFFSIGSNDLTQFVMACDRGNGAVAHLFDPMHPALVELMSRVINHGCASGKSVTICGDVAADPRHTIALLNCGLRDLSMSSAALAGVRTAILASEEARLD